MELLDQTKTVIESMQNMMVAAKEAGGNRRVGYLVVYFQQTMRFWGTGIRWLMRDMATLTQGNQELLVVRDKVGRPQVSLR